MVVATREVSGCPLCCKGGRWLVASQPTCGHGPPLLNLHLHPNIAVRASRMPSELFLCYLASRLELNAPSLELEGLKDPVKRPETA